MERTSCDFIIRIKNGYMSKKETIVISYSKFNEALLKKLKSLSYLADFKVIGDKVKKIEVDLLYKNGNAVLTDVKIFSKPGRRNYVSYADLKPVLGGLGWSIVSTPNGILTGREARKAKVGGELLFEIW